jgi:hypothetical protein
MHISISEYKATYEAYTIRALFKEYRLIRDLLIELKEHLKSGHKYYLGDNVLVHILDNKKALKAITFEITVNRKRKLPK